MSDSKKTPGSLDSPSPWHCHREYHDSAKWYIVCGKTSLDALVGVPQLNSVWSEDRRDIICTELKWGEIPQTFCEWLFRRPKRWWVTAYFDKRKAKDAEPNTPANA